MKCSFTQGISERKNSPQYVFIRLFYQAALDRVHISLAHTVKSEFLLLYEFCAGEILNSAAGEKLAGFLLFFKPVTPVNMQNKHTLFILRSIIALYKLTKGTK